MVSRIALIGVCLVPLHAATLSGQDVLPVEVGARVRLWAPDVGLMKASGVVARIGADTLYLQGETTAYPVPTTAITRIQVSAGRRGAAPVLGGVLGFLGGAGLGLAYGAAGHPGLPHIGADVPSEAEYLLPFSLLGAVGGALLGARAQDKWRPGRMP